MNKYKYKYIYIYILELYFDFSQTFDGIYICIPGDCEYCNLIIEKRGRASFQSLNF